MTTTTTVLDASEAVAKDPSSLQLMTDLIKTRDKFIASYTERFIKALAKICAIVTREFVEPFPIYVLPISEDKYKVCFPSIPLEVELPVTLSTATHRLIEIARAEMNLITVEDILKVHY